MILEKHGNIFESNAQTLVNPVNCEGFMGRGLALEMRQRYPEVDLPYREACATHDLRPGILQIVKLPTRWILNFPTKNKWRAKSRIDYIQDGLVFLAAHYQEWGVISLAFPQLGSGLGGLDWAKVRPVMLNHLTGFDISVEIWLQTPEEALIGSGRKRRSDSQKLLPF
jgi:O-acetyl-ADP-ribose deacetylase (regulator of RNase III)